MKKFALAAALIASFGLFGSVVLTNAAPSNLITNPSVETANAANTLPLSWNQGKWGTNTTAFTYKTTEGNSGTKSLYINTTKYTNGDAKWYFTDVTVKPNQQYTYTEFYKSSVATEVDAQYTDTAGKLSYVWLNSPAVSATSYKSLSSTFTTPANIKTLTIFHVINKVGWLQTDDFSLAEGASTVTPTPPTVTISAPLVNANIAGTTALSATATDTIGMGGVQFKVDNTNIGAEDTTTPYSVSWDSKSVANGTHTITAIARNSSNLTTTVSETVNVQNSITPPPTPPTVAFTNPAANSTISGPQGVAASTSADAVGVQFKLDGNNLGAEDTVAPYTINWDTTTVNNGSHTLSAIGRNTSNLTATATETVNVQNTVVTPPPSNNLIVNPSFETANGAVPASWLSSSWGTNTSTFSYLNTGHTGNRSVRVDATNYTNGASNWYYSAVPVTAGKTYKYENWYQSNVDTEVDAEVQMNDGSTQYFWLGVVLASSNWAKFSTTFTPPAGAKNIAVYQLLAKQGYIVSDDYFLGEFTPSPLNRGLVTVTLDDGWASQYQNGLPILNKYGLKGTFYIISGELTDQPDYMSGTQVKNLQSSGMEIGSHTVSHIDLTQASQTQLVTEMSQSQATLQNLLGVPVINFAYPYGAYNSNTITVGKQYYQSQRTVNAGYNTKDNFDITQLRIYEVDSNISNAQVQGWIQGAITQKAWLVLVYHEVGANIGGDIYHVTTPNFDAQMSYLKNSGVAVVTLNQAINEIQPQL